MKGPAPVNGCAGVRFAADPLEGVSLGSEDYNRQSRLQETEMAARLEDGATYRLISDISTAEIVSTQEAKAQPDLALVMV